jgi:hypothetical protein
MDRILVTKIIVTGGKHRPKYTVWNPRTVNKTVKAHIRKTRRAYKQYLKTGSIRDFDRANKLMTSWDFD